MKNTIYVIIIILSSFIISCEDSFLEKQPIGSFGEAQLGTEDGVQALLIGCYSDLNSGTRAWYRGPMLCMMGVMSGGEANKGSDPGDLSEISEFHQLAVSTGNRRSERTWTWCWDAIDRCNTVLKVMAEVESIDAETRTQIEAETRFLRGYFYWLCKIQFGNIPWIDETTEDIRVPNTDESGNYVNIWPQITADFDFARKNLPATQSDNGRPNSWAADLFYAKVLMYRAGEGEYSAGYTEALAILKNGINNGVTQSGEPYGLLPLYHSNFDPAMENGPESVWMIQCEVNDGTAAGKNGSPNGMMGAQFWSSVNAEGPGLGRGYGFYQPTEWFVNHFRVNPNNGLPYLDMFETESHELADDYGLTAGDPFEVDTWPVDPRLDWNVGRRGVPFLGYGDFQAAWIRNQTFGGPYFMKKFHVYKDKMDVYTGVGNCYPSINIPVMRFADVLLLTAECEARVGSLDNARTLVNQVRQRMIDNSDNPENWVKREDGTDAANYLVGLYPAGGVFGSKETALEAILYERTLELGFEGSRFFDLKRFGKAQEECNGFLDYSSERHDYLAEGSYEETDAIWPIPRNAVDLSQKEGVPTLKQNPGY